MNRYLQDDLFDHSSPDWGLPSDFVPRVVSHFDPQVIILSKGSLITPDRENFNRKICAAYPKATVIEQLDTPHNQIDLGPLTPLQSQRIGKQTLVLGELGNSVRFSAEEHNTCPNYWHFSVYGFCPFGCKYCYLAGTRGIWFSPTVKIFLNLKEVLTQIDIQARRLAKPVAFYHGKLQDGLALDPLTAYSTVLIPFFARHPFARHVLLTKSSSIDRLLDLDHAGHTTLSWSLNPASIIEKFEQNVPTLDQRLDAMHRCANAGYPVRAVIMPVIPVPNWKEIYAEFLEQLLTKVNLERLTFGGICIYKQARNLMEEHLGKDNVLSSSISPSPLAGDGRDRFSPNLRADIYSHLISTARKLQPGLKMALCLEEEASWDQVHLNETRGRCNCVL